MNRLHDRISSEPHVTFRIPIMTSFVILCFCSFLSAQTSTELNYAPSPADNPLKGLVPYSGQGDPFPHSLEFWYFPMNQLMIGKNQFDWTVTDEMLDTIARRGCQAVIRVYMEYPTKDASFAPQFLIDEGVKVTKYQHDKDVTHAIDYNDPRTVDAMVRFIKAFGEKYDGDPRLGFITMGILGQWGEWHTYPRDDLWASKKTQASVMDAFEKAFQTTKVLMRYPAGDETWEKAPNDKRPFGYHDDSFAWATLDTGNDDDSWFYMPALAEAGQGAVDKWKTQPIGGEIRPEIWGCVFDKPSCAPKGQEFEKCVEITHASWLMDSGMFSLGEKPTPERRAEAIRQIQKMGYELYVQSVDTKIANKKLDLNLKIENKGVAPFYYDWPIEIAVTDMSNNQLAKVKTDWRLSQIMPDKVSQWKTSMELARDEPNLKIFLRAVNPLKGGRPFRFANETQRPNGVLVLKQ